MVFRRIYCWGSPTIDLNLRQHKWNMWHNPPPPPHFNDPKIASFCSFAPLSLFWWRGGRGFILSFSFCPRTKQREHLGHPFPHFNDPKMETLLVRTFIIVLVGGRGFIVSFYSVQDCNLLQNKWNIWATPSPIPLMPKWRVFAPSRLHYGFGGN